MEKVKNYDRYQRQMLLDNFGEIAQSKLFEAKVLVVGAGGLGCPILQYLAGAGVGTIGIVDADRVSLNNLQRQILYGQEDIGHFKVDSARWAVSRVNREINVCTHNVFLSKENAMDIISGYDIIMDGTDNFATRYLINDVCVLLKKRLVYGAVYKFEGQVTVFSPIQTQIGNAINYRDIFPELPAAKDAPACNEVGVLGALTGIIGTMMAAEAIKLITGIGEPLINKLLVYNLLSNQMQKMDLAKLPDSDALLPKNETEFLAMDYTFNCRTYNTLEIEPLFFRKLVIKREVLVIDVRKSHELPLLDSIVHINIPLEEITNKDVCLEADLIITICQSGIRSLKAASFLKQRYPQKSIYSLRGGLANL